ncbi:MAG: TetR/AcrR family transcriptional regulator [Bdellovibrionales bacterium]
MANERRTNRDRILDSGLELFNQNGTVAVTTNHIAKHLEISPGNLYFHFRNKEEILRQLFEYMCTETYALFPSRKNEIHMPTPEGLIESAFEVFFKYRCFHREMYHLRRNDPKLSAVWKKHLSKTNRLLLAAYAQWVRHGLMRSARRSDEMKFIADTVLITSNAFLNFYESPEKPARKASLRQGVEYTLRILEPYRA